MKLRNLLICAALYFVGCKSHVSIPSGVLENQAQAAGNGVFCPPGSVLQGIEQNGTPLCVHLACRVVNIQKTGSSCEVNETLVSVTPDCRRDGQSYSVTAVEYSGKDTDKSTVRTLCNREGAPIDGFASKAVCCGYQISK